MTSELEAVFRADIPPRVEKLAEGLEASSPEPSVAATAHGLRGAARIAKHVALADLCDAAEAAVLAGDARSAAQVAAGLRAWLDAYRGQPNG